MADKRIIDLPLFTGGTKLKPADVLPIHNTTASPTEATEQITGQQITNGVFDTTNNTNNNLFKAMHYNEDKVLRQSTQKVLLNTGGFIAHTVGTTDTTGGVYDNMQVWYIKFKIILSTSNNTTHVAEYTATYEQQTSGNFVQTTLNTPNITNFVQNYNYENGAAPFSNISVYANALAPSGQSYGGSNVGIYIYVTIGNIAPIVNIKLISETILPQF